MEKREKASPKSPVPSSDQPYRSKSSAPSTPITATPTRTTITTNLKAVPPSPAIHDSEKLIVTASLHPFWKSTRGILLVVVVFLAIIGAIIGGVVGGRRGKDEARAYVLSRVTVTTVTRTRPRATRTVTTTVFVDGVPVATSPAILTTPEVVVVDTLTQTVVESGTATVTLSNDHTLTDIPVTSATSSAS